MESNKDTERLSLIMDIINMSKECHEGNVPAMSIHVVSETKENILNINNLTCEIIYGNMINLRLPQCVKEIRNHFNEVVLYFSCFKQKHYHKM